MIVRAPSPRSCLLRSTIGSLTRVPASGGRERDKSSSSFLFIRMKSPDAAWTLGAGSRRSSLRVLRSFGRWELSLLKSSRSNASTNRSRGSNGEAHCLLPRIIEWSFSKGSRRIISLTLYPFSSRRFFSCRKIADGSFETSMLLAFTANKKSPSSLRYCEMFSDRILAWSGCAISA